MLFWVLNYDNYTKYTGNVILNSKLRKSLEKFFWFVTHKFISNVNSILSLFSSELFILYNNNFLIKSTLNQTIHIYYYKEQQNIENYTVEDYLKEMESEK